MTICRGQVGQMYHLPSFFFFIVNKNQSLDLNKKSTVHNSAAKCNGETPWQHVLKRLKLKNLSKGRTFFLLGNYFHSRTSEAVSMALKNKQTNKKKVVHKGT